MPNEITDSSWELQIHPHTIQREDYGRLSLRVRRIGAGGDLRYPYPGKGVAADGTTYDLMIMSSWFEEPSRPESIPLLISGIIYEDAAKLVRIVSAPKYIE